MGLISRLRPVSVVKFMAKEVPRASRCGKHASPRKSNLSIVDVDGLLRFHFEGVHGRLRFNFEGAPLLD